MSDVEESDDDLDFVLHNQSTSRARPRHPPPEHILQLWKVFIENIDPLTKVVHVPTLQPAFQKAAKDVTNIPRSFEALMFAVYSTATMSLKDDECKVRFSASRKSLLSRYMSMTKSALSRAKLLGTSNLVLLQAFVLYMIVGRDLYEPRAVWSMTGVALRIAECMGLERDGQALGLPPFESEIRRRVWWLLKTHDYRLAELCGLPKFRDLDTGMDSNKFPSNVNDDQIYPGMPSLPLEGNTMKDAVFVSMRYELIGFAGAQIARFRQQGKTPSQWDLHGAGSDKAEIYKAFEGVEETLESKYLRYCDPSQPLHLMAMVTARQSLNLVRFLTHHPRRWASLEQTPLSEREWIWGVSVKILEQHSMIQSNSQLKPFAWHASWSMPWHTFIHVLDTLRANPLAADADKTWQLVGNIYDHSVDLIVNTKRSIHVAVGTLCVKAYNAREAALLRRDGILPPTPDFVVQLREQREVAKAKREARGMRNSHLGSEGLDSGTKSDPSFGCDPARSEQDPALQQLNQATSDTTITEDPFWFINSFDNPFGSFNDIMDIDLDLTMTQDQNVDANAPQPIAWEQWDAWIADSNLPVTRPRGS